MRMMVLVLLAMLCLPALAQDIRYCSDKPNRDADGRILRGDRLQG